MAHNLTAQDCPPDIAEDVLSRQLFALVPTITIMVLAIATYVLRLFCRRQTGQKLWWDDYIMGIGLLIALEPSICELLLVQNGLGHHVCNVPHDQVVRFLRISFALNRANQPALFCIRTSIVLFYMRIFATKKFRIAAYCVLAYNLVWAITTWSVNLTTCSPIPFYYDKTIKGGHCRNQAITGSINGVLSLLGDIFVLCLPVPVVLNLKISKKKKFGILAIFLLGVFVCVASAIRIVELTKFVFTDPTYTQFRVSTWTSLEQSVSVVSGNLPLLAPLLERYCRKGGCFGSGSDDFSFGAFGRQLGSSEGQRNSKYNSGLNPRTSFRPNLGGDIISGCRPGDSDHPWPLGDEESQTRAESVDSAHDIELDDKPILTKTRVYASEPGEPDKTLP